jgi:hypothetical protein
LCEKVIQNNAGMRPRIKTRHRKDSLPGWLMNFLALLWDALARALWQNGARNTQCGLHGDCMRKGRVVMATAIIIFIM